MEHLTAWLIFFRFMGRPVSRVPSPGTCRLRIVMGASEGRSQRHRAQLNWTSFLSRSDCTHNGVNGGNPAGGDWRRCCRLVVTPGTVRGGGSWPARLEHRESTPAGNPAVTVATAPIQNGWCVAIEPAEDALLIGGHVSS